MKIRRKAVVRIGLRIGLVVLALFVAYAYGYLCQERRLPGYQVSRSVYVWCRGQPILRQVHFFLRENVTHRSISAADPGWQFAKDGAPSLTGDRESDLAKLHALGYLSGYEPAPESENVTIYVPGLAFDGLNLYTSGHGQEAILMDMKGKVLHSWSYEHSEALPDHPEPSSSWRTATWPWAHLYPNGDLLAIYDHAGMLKLDKNSNLIWASDLPFHHRLFVDDDDDLIYGITGELNLLPLIREHEPIMEDFITILDHEGNHVRSVSLVEAFARSSYASLLLDDRMMRVLDSNVKSIGDLIHTNTIEVFDGSFAHRSPIFKKGNVLISGRELNVIAIVDLEEEKVVWALTGQWLAQHTPSLLDNGNILLLDNRGHHGMSKAVEIDPFTQEIVWAYEGTPENGFYSFHGGLVERLANGNTLIVEHAGGRAFEVTPDKKIVWEFYNPARAGKRGELIASLFMLRRLGPDFPMPWLEVSTDDPS